MIADIFTLLPSILDKEMMKGTIMGRIALCMYMLPYMCHRELNKKFERGHENLQITQSNNLWKICIKRMSTGS